MTDRLSWGILATGAIARTFAKGVAHSKTGRLVAVGSRSLESAEKFASEFQIPNIHGSYQALLADPQVQAVYIATPHPLHALSAIRAAEARKHILVEKPIGLNHAEAMAIFEAAQANDVYAGEAFMYRTHPQTQKLVELIRDKAIGDVRIIQATFSFHWPKPWNPDSRLTCNALGGGGILDVGCYPVSMARLIAGAATGAPFADPVQVKGAGHVGPTGCDEWASALLKFPNNIIAHISTGVQVNQENVVRIYGSEGWLLIPEPWTPAREGGASKILLHRPGDKQPQEILIESDQWLYSIEADTVALNIANRQPPSPAMSWDDTLGNMKTLDAWRREVGVTYDAEKPEDYPKTTIAGRPLQRGMGVSPMQIPHATIPHLNKPVSRLVMGCDNQPGFPHAAVMWDDYFSRGGNTFDTAHIYGGGQFEKLLGAWIKLRNIRNEVAIIVKGAHTPFCDPKNLTTQLHQSLDRLQTDHADIYIMHRDNPDIPAGEFVDVLNEHVRAGRIKSFGGSNWTLARIDQANAYAKSHNLQPFSVVSNNFSLARMVEPPWAGCVSASDAESRAWFARTQTPLFAWSSQARGFFVRGHIPAEDQSDKELVRCWYSSDNAERLKRARELAEKRKVDPINVALAYVLNQPFPTFALIGPRTLAETRTTLPALAIQLTPQELRWLNLDDDPRAS